MSRLTAETGEMLIQSVLEKAIDEIDGFQTNFADGESDDADSCCECRGVGLVDKAVGIMEALSIVLRNQEFDSVRAARLVIAIRIALANLEVGSVDSAVRAYQRYCERSGKTSGDEGEDQDLDETLSQYVAAVKSANGKPEE